MADIPVLRAAHFTTADVEAGPLRVDDDGRISGYVAQTGVCHRGAPGCMTLEALESRGSIDYDGGHTSSPFRLDDGTEVRTLALTMRGGHPLEHLTAQEARAHHDDTATVVADVVVSRHADGLAISGSVRPHLDADDLRELIGSSPSIEIWPDAQRGNVLLGIQLVPTPAWPVAASVDGAVTVRHLGEPCDPDPEPTLADVVARLDTLERFVAAATVASL